MLCGLLFVERPECRFDFNLTALLNAKFIVDLSVFTLAKRAFTTSQRLHQVASNAS